MGALNLLADITETHPAFELLRKHGFSVYSWENVWKLPTAVPPAVHFKDSGRKKKRLMNRQYAAFIKRLSRLWFRPLSLLHQEACTDWSTGSRKS